MKTLLIRGSNPPPAPVRDIIKGGSTEVVEVARAEDVSRTDADRIVEWNGREVIFGDRRLRWPEDEDELRLLFETAG